MRTHALLIATLVLVPSLRQQSAGQPDELVSVGTHRLQVHLEGRGSPAIVIDAGLGDRFDKLRPLQARLAQTTQVVTYNRAGYGASEAGPLPRDAAREAEEIRALLEKAGVPGPYVLVGHSLGGLNVQVFASMHPADVAGMVLLDPPPLSFILGQTYPDLRQLAERMTAEWEAAANAAAKSPDAGDRAQSAFLRMLASEHREMFGGSARTVDGITTFGDLPLVVMAAGKANPAFGAVADEYQRYWIGQSRALAARSSRGRFVLAEGASHYLYQDAPDLVVEAILSVVAQARAK
jgi:pimeloyl-ACP methyl ester carboxylesterase